MATNGHGLIFTSHAHQKLNESGRMLKGVSDLLRVLCKCTGLMIELLNTRISQQHHLGTIGVINIRWVQHSCVFDKRLHLFMQDVEVTRVTQLERPYERKGIHPGEDCIKKVTGDVEALIASSQLHHVTVSAI